MALSPVLQSTRRFLVGPDGSSAPTVLLKHSRVNLQETPTYTDIETFSAANPTDQELSYLISGGDLEVRNADFNELAFWLTSRFGIPTTTGSSGSFVHTWDIHGRNQAAIWPMVAHVGDADIAEEYHNVVLRSFGMDFPSFETPPTFSGNAIAGPRTDLRNEGDTASVGTVDTWYEYPTAPLIGGKSKAQLAASINDLGTNAILDLKSFGVEFGDNVEKDDQFGNTVLSFDRLVRKAHGITANFVVEANQRMQSLVKLSGAGAGTTNPKRYLRFIADGSRFIVGTSGTKYQLMLTMSGKIRKTGNKSAAGEVIAESFQFMPMEDSAWGGKVAQIVLKCAVPGTAFEEGEETGGSAGGAGGSGAGGSSFGG